MEEVNGLVRQAACAGFGLASMLLPSPRSSAADSRPLDTVVYCVKDAEGEWRLQNFAPLIDIHGRQVFARVSYNGSWLRTALFRSFTESRELAFEFKFDTVGKLSARHGYLRRFGGWQADADLFPSADGTLPELRVNYTRGHGNTIAEPDDGRLYVRDFKTVPMYRTIDELPCAAGLRALEKK